MPEKKKKKKKEKEKEKEKKEVGDRSAPVDRIAPSWRGVVPPGA